MQCRTCGSVRGALGNRRPYRDRTEFRPRDYTRALVIDEQ
jgi:hypothetical protein